MPAKKKGNNRFKKDPETDKFLPKRDESQDQTYAVVTRMLGNRRILAKCEDQKERLCIIPGKFKGKKNWISVGNLILLNIRDYQDSKYDVIYVYTSNDFKRLKRDNELYKLIPEGFDDEATQNIFFYENDKEEQKTETDNIDSSEEIDLETL